VKGKIIVDILDPHSSSYSDAIPKAKGLAKYAEKHGTLFGRIELIHKVNGRLKRLDLKDEATRRKILKATERPHLDGLFEELGE
jgi:type III restriction enzyme